jgi:hypothetical protein
VLSGLRSRGAAAPYAKGLAMQSAAGLNMEGAKQNQQLGVAQMQADSQARVAQARNQADRAGNASRERVQSAGLDRRQSVFDIGRAFDYAGLQKRNNLRWQQALFNAAVSDL